MNSNDSNKAWDLVDTDLIEYNQRQYDQKYRSTDFIISCLREEIQEDFKYEILDVGCGGGANLSHIARVFPKCRFTGVDLNQYFISFANERHSNIPNTSFNVSDFMELEEEKYDIVGSSQFLEVLDFEKADKFKHKCFKIAKKGVFFQALFTKRLLDFEINIHDYKYEKVVPYNIFSIQKLKDIASSYGFKLKRAKEFIIDMDLPDSHVGRGTYTIKKEDGERMQFSDVLHLPWYFLYFEKRA